MSKVKTQLVIDGKNNTQKAFKEVSGELDGMNKKLATAGKALVAAFSVSALTGAVRGIAQAADSYNLMNARLKLATGSQEEFNTAQAELGNIARRTQTPVASLVTLYGRISRPLKEVGRTQADILKVTEAVATSFRVSGASAQEAENGVIQFAQALGSGALRGDEFNSVAEQAPRLMQALADSIGVPVGALKEMAAQGLLTASVVTDALVGQLDTLRAEAATLPQTVGGAMTELTDEWNKAIGGADLSVLIGSIKELAQTVSDPAVVEGLVKIASAMATLAGWTVNVASEFAVFADKVAFTAAQLSAGSGETAKQVQELEKLKRSLKEVNAAQTGSSFIGSATTPLLMKYFAPEQLDAWAKELEDKIKTFEERLYGIAEVDVSDEMEFLAEVGKAVAEKARQDEVDSYAKYLGELKKLQDRQVSDATAASKKLVSAEKKATSDLEKVRGDRLKIEERYREALAGLGGEGEASYGGAQALQAAAQSALSSGDIAAAQANAQAALKMLQDLAAAGGNTYGFEGFIQELQAIELAANDIEQTRAAEKIASIKAEIADLDAKAQALKDSPISFKMDEASIQAIRSQIEALAAQLGAQLTIPVTVGHPDGPIITAMPPVPGFATGTDSAPPGMAWVGEKGPELVSFRGGEQVFTAEASKRLAATMAGMPMSRMGDSGVAETVANMSGPTPGRDLGRVDLSVGGESFSLLAEGDQFERILRQTSRKHGRTHRN